MFALVIPPELMELIQGEAKKIIDDISESSVTNIAAKADEAKLRCASDLLVGVNLTAFPDSTLVATSLANILAAFTNGETAQEDIAKVDALVEKYAASNGEDLNILFDNFLKSLTLLELIRMAVEGVRSAKASGGLVGQEGSALTDKREASQEDAGENEDSSP